MKKIMVTGSTGQLGQEFMAISQKDDDHIFIFTDRSQLNLSDKSSLELINKVSPDVLIHCAAYTAVDQAEKEKKLARELNGYIMRDIGQICSELNIPVIHFSSDYVYHNRLRRPLREGDPARPKSQYAKSKLLGEKLLQENHPYPLIFRVSWLYSTYGHNFPKTMLRLGSEREQLTIVNDQIGSPTYAKDVAKMVMEIIDQCQTTDDWRSKSGVYNYTNEGQTNWSEIAAHIMDKAGLDCKIIPIPSIKYPTPAARPRHSVLNLINFKRIFQLPIRPWKKALDECLDTLLNERGAGAVN